MKNKKIVICIFVIVFIVLAIIGCAVYKAVTTIDNDKIGSIEGNEELVADDVLNQSEDTTNQITEPVVENEQQTTEFDGKIKVSDGFEFDEEDLKDKIGTYLVYENFMQDYFVPNQEDENVNIVDYANEAKVIIGYSLVLYSDPLSSVIPTEEQVRKAVEEFCGEHYEKYIDTAEYWMAFDGDNAYEFVEAGDYTASGYCNEIEKIEKGEDGKYTVTFIYSRPTDWDFMDGTLDQVQKYRKQFTFIYHEDAQYTKYQLTELSFLKGEEV